MISLRANGNVIYTTTSDKPNDEDYDKLVPFLQEISRHHDSVNWYFELENIKGWEPGGKWEDPEFEFTNREGIEKIALVADEHMVDTFKGLVKPFSEAEVRFYSPDKKEDAKLWVE